MNPNPEIYGGPETWQTCKYFPWTGGSYTALKVTKPKVPNFDGVGDGSLYAGDAAGKTVLNTPIDKSVCPCGQDNTVSCFGDISAFQNQRDSDSNKVPTIYEPEGDVSNWFLYDGKASAEQFTNQGMTNGRNTVDNKYQLWSPDAVVGTTSNPNMNLKINPFVEWGIKSMLMLITVQCITGFNNNDEPTTTWRTLDNWYNNYSQQPICGVSFIIRGLSSASASTITYRNTNGANNNFCGVGLLDKIDGICDYYRFNMRSATASVCEFIPFQCIKGNYYANANIQVFMLGIHRFAGMTIEAHTRVNTQTGWCVWVDIPCTEYNYNMILKMAACFGIPFTPKDKYSFPADYIDDDLYLPIIDKNGITHGEYTHGADNANNDYLELDSIRDKDYKPDAQTDKNTYSLTTSFNTVGHVASTTKAYVVNGNALTGLSVEMWNILNNLVTTPDDMTNLDNLTLDAFLTNNPIDAIVSVKKFPLSSVPHAESLENIYLGKYQTSAAGYALALQQARYNFEGIPIFPKFGNCFLDYSPYTKMQLYVPFCGTIDIDAADFMGRTLSVEMVIDFITGAVTAYVLANQLVVTSLTGNCGIDIPITGTEQSTVSAALESAILQDKSARGNYTLKGSVGGMLTNPIGNLTHPTTAIENRFSTKIQTMQANYNLQHVEMPLRQIGSASPLNSWALEFVCRLIIYYPDGECISFNATNEPSLIDEKVSAFGAVNGFATVETDTLNNFTGFTQVSDVDLSGVSATDTEKEMILNLLQSGVYL